MRALFLWLSNRRWLGRLAMAMPLVRRMPFRFVAGTTLDQAVEAVRALNATGASATLDVLGEAVTDRAAADRAAAAYVAAIERIAAEGLDANVSIKLTQMGLDLGDEACLAVMAPVVAAGDRHGIFIRIDMESSAYTGRTLDIVHRLRAEGHDIGPVIQSYLHRSPADVERLAADRVRTRVCKGAYAEPPEVALQEREAIGDAFVALCQRLLEADAYPGVASHDQEMLSRVAAFAEERGIGKDRYEFQTALRHPARPPAPAPGRWPSASRLRALRHRVVPVLHAPPRRAAGERAVRAAERHRGSRVGFRGVAPRVYTVYTLPPKRRGPHGRRLACQSHVRQQTAEHLEPPPLSHITPIPRGRRHPAPVRPRSGGDERRLSQRDDGVHRPARA